MRLDEFYFYPGRITYNEFHIDFSIDYDKQLNHLNEDLFQVCFPQGYLLDLGWYPEHQENGCFIIQVIFRSAWDTPIFKAEAIDEEEMVEKVNEAIALIRSYLWNITQWNDPFVTDSGQE